jgi:hypothetical protein
MRLRKSSHLAACMLTALISVSAHAADHILTITINEYAPNASVGPLDGVQEDRGNALKIAQRLGFDISNPVQIQNSQATLAGIRNALANLQRVTAGNDRVFVYYSGHGGTKQVSSICQSSLVTYEDEDLLSSEFYEYLDRIRKKVPKQLFVMLDSCHSGEFTDRGSRAKGTGGTATMRPKMRTKAKDGQPTCNAPVNFVVSSIDAFDKSRHAAKGTINESLGGQMIMLSAAKENEVAWDSDNGGAATSAALRCLSEPGLQSAEGSGFISAVALSRCTQAKIDTEQPLATRQHVVAHGQTTAPLMPALSSGGKTVAIASNTLEALAQNSDPTWQVQAEPYVGQQWRENGRLPYNWSNTQRIKIGSPDRLQITVQSQRAGYVYLVYASRDSNQFALLYPGESQNFTAHIQANNPLTIPSRWPAEGNNGKPEQDTILAIVSEQPMPELHQYLQGGAKAATADLSQKLASATSACKSLGATEERCTRGAKKSLGSGETKGGDGANARYGAARVIVDEY